MVFQLFYQLAFVLLLQSIVGRRCRFRCCLVSPTPIPFMQHSNKHTCKYMRLHSCASYDSVCICICVCVCECVRALMRSAAAGRQLIHVAIGDEEMDHWYFIHKCIVVVPSFRFFLFYHSFFMSPFLCCLAFATLNRTAGCVCVCSGDTLGRIRKNWLRKLRISKVNCCGANLQILL